MLDDLRFSKRGQAAGFAVIALGALLVVGISVIRSPGRHAAAYSSPAWHASWLRDSRTFEQIAAARGMAPNQAISFVAPPHAGCYVVLEEEPGEFCCIPDVEFCTLALIAAR